MNYTDCIRMEEPRTVLSGLPNRPHGCLGDDEHLAPHKEVLRQIAGNGGNIPKELLDGPIVKQNDNAD
jgi:hypothetical protein